MNLASFRKILRERSLRLPLWYHVLVTLTAVFLAPLRGGAAPELPAAATD